MENPSLRQPADKNKLSSIMKSAPRPYIVVTSISPPNDVLKSIAEGAAPAQFRFVVIGDTKSPPDFALNGCRFLSVYDQKNLNLRYASICPERSYTRKNIGYLIAISENAPYIVETDDDNFPMESFWYERDPRVTGDGITGEGWVNAYAFFTDLFIYPRGFPLREARNLSPTTRDRVPAAKAEYCPIQQGLADENPDVDAIYRLLYPLPFTFEKQSPLILTRGQWCPFNSQNTTFFPEAYPLMYLPAYCSFRMTDIWRSFVAQRIAWEYGWKIAFHSATVYQERNEHDLMKDFEDEVPGYLYNEGIATALDATKLSSSPGSIFANLRKCYETLINMDLVSHEELTLLEAWSDDLRRISAE
jgi:hypothetical protein